MYKFGVGVGHLQWFSTDILRLFYIFYISTYCYILRGKCHYVVDLSMTRDTKQGFHFQENLPKSDCY